MKLVFNLLTPLKSRDFESFALEIQILRLVCSLLWLFVTISLSLSQINIETKLLVITLGILTAADISLRSFKLVEIKKNGHITEKVLIEENS